MILEIRDKYVCRLGRGEDIPFVFANTQLGYVEIGGESSIKGYIDTFRIYDRLLTRYEVASNAQYSRVYFTYRIGSSSEQLSKWNYKAYFEPLSEQRADGIYLNTDSVSKSDYNLLSFLYQSDIEDELSISSNSVLYRFKPIFTATLTAPFYNIEDKEIYIKAHGSVSNYIDNLNIGDTLVMQEGESTLEGVVTSLNKVTGLVAVADWLGDIPTSGFTENAKVYKWQREYISLFEYSGIPIVLKGNGKIKDIQLLSAYEEDLPPSNDEAQYLQYRFIFTTTKPYLTPYLSSVNINYSSAGPRMDQILRHGKWFNEEGQQPFWWSK